MPTDKEHADAIRAAATVLNAATRDAGVAGLAVAVRVIDITSTGGNRVSIVDARVTRDV